MLGSSFERSFGCMKRFRLVTDLIGIAYVESGMVYKFTNILYVARYIRHGLKRQPFKYHLEEEEEENPT